MRRVFFGLVVAGLVVSATMSVLACPFCAGPQLTLAEQVQEADAVLLVKWVGGVPAKDQDPGSTNYEVVEALRKDQEKKFPPGEAVSLVRYRVAKPGDLFLLLGTKMGATLDWGSPLEISKEGFHYLKGVPSPKLAPTERLEYFLGYLEHPDSMISTDAYGEFAKANYEDIVQLAKKMPRKQLRTWLESPETSASRLGLYGLMLGLCGDAGDAELMREKIVNVQGDFRLGIDGVMGGYLLLTGDDGLAVLEETKINDKKSPFSETYAAMGAIRFMWQYGKGQIQADRLRSAMRLMLDRPELADLVIADLARMEDWTAQDQLMALYGAEGYDIPSIKRAVVRYMLASAKFKPEMPDQAEPEHVAKGKKYLAQLEERDPKTVKDAKRFWVTK
ncbi:MAG: hypothetical protein U0872_13735 [Planctomycetaceae bacterium]